jgi:integrase
VAIRKIQRKGGTSYVITWREEDRRQRSRSFNRRKDADAFEAKIKLAKRRGDLDDIDAGKQRLRDYMAEWWRIDAEPRLAPKTLQLYSSWQRRHILPRLGHVELRKLTPEMIGSFQAQLVAAGVGLPTVHKVMVFLQGALERAVAWRRISSNPVRLVKKRPQPRRLTIRPPGPEEIERLRAHLLRQGRERDLRDATLVSVLAYAGLRPGEALALTWGDIQRTRSSSRRRWPSGK